MADQTEVIRQQMEETRASLSEKVEALEKQVADTVKDTAQTVAETVHTATETVDRTVSTVSDTVQAVTETFNISGHIERHPMLAVGGAIAVGYLLGTLLRRRRAHRPEPARAQASAPAPTPAPAPVPQAAARKPAESTPSQGPGLLDILGRVKELAIGTAVGVFSQAIMNAVPQNMRSGLMDLVKDVTKKLGGTPPGQNQS